MRFPARVALTLAIMLAGAATAAAEAKPSPAVKCRDSLQKYLAHATPGAFYYVEDGRKHYCGWSFADPDRFDAYPSLDQRAFTACQNGAERAGLTLACLPIARGRTIVAAGYADARAQAGDSAPTPDPWRCGQEPGSRFYWVERGWCDVPAPAPREAQGVVLWNHGIAWTVVQYTAPPALALRLLLRRGWEVLKLNRNNLGEGENSRWRTRERLLEEVKNLRERGYRRIVLAGQSFGGYLTLDASAEPGFFGAVAFAPGPSRDSEVYGLISRMQADRVALVFPGGDLLFGSPARGRTAAATLRARGGAHLVFDEETGGLTGHGGGTGATFALRYGACLADFLSAPTLPRGPFTCPPPPRWAIARELLAGVPDDVRIIHDPDRLPAGMRDLAGIWYGVLNETVASIAPVERAGKPFALLFRETGSLRMAVVIDVDVADGTLRGSFRNRNALTVRILNPGAVEITVAAPSAGQSNFSQLGAAADLWRGVLTRVEAD